MTAAYETSPRIVALLRDGKSHLEVAKAVGVSTSLVAFGAKVLAFGCEELIAKVMSHEISVTTGGRLADYRKGPQRLIIKAGKGAWIVAARRAGPSRNRMGGNANAAVAKVVSGLGSINRGLLSSSVGMEEDRQRLRENIMYCCRYIKEAKQYL